MEKSINSKDIEVEPVEKRSASNFSAFINIVCVVAGTGILGLPYALKLSGWFTIVLFFVIAFMAYYTGVMLIQCLYYKEKRLENYPEIGYASFGIVGQLVVQLFHYINLLSSACIYILLTGMNLHILTRDYNLGIDLTLWIFMAGVVVSIPSVLFKTLKEVAILTFFAMLSTIVVVASIIAMGFIDMPNNLDQTHMLFDPSKLPMAIGTIAFSFGGTNVYPHIEATMKNGKSFNKTYLVAVIFIAFLYISTAVMGYSTYGDSVQSPVLNSLPEGVVKMTSIILITLHVAFAAPLFICSFCLEVEEKLNIVQPKMSFLKEFLIRFLFRLATVMAITVIAIYLPFFTDFMALFGSITSCSLTFILPVLFHYKLFGFKKRKIVKYIMDFLVFFVGVFGFVIGGYQSIVSLISDFETDSHTSDTFENFS